MKREYCFVISLTLASICLSGVLLSPIVISEEKTATAAGVLLSDNWSTQTAYPVPYPSYTQELSIAADADSRAHIAFIHAWNNTLRNLVYATNSGGSWHNETICSVPGDYFIKTAILVPSDGLARIGLANRTGVFFFEKSSGAWTRSTIDAGPVESSTMTMLLDNNGAIRFYYAMNSVAREAVREAMGWRIQDILNTSAWGPVALDSAGQVHTAMATSDGLVHLSNVTGSWKTEIVDEGSVPKEISVGFSGPPANKVTIAYTDNMERNMKVASNSTGGWTFSIIHSGTVSLYSNGLSSAHISETYDPKYPIQNIRMAFFSGSDLTVATADVVGPTYMGGDSVIDEGVGSIGQTAMSSNSAGHVHLLYLNSRDGALKYATDSFSVPRQPFVEVESGYHSVTLRWNWYENYGENHTYEFRIFRISQGDTSGKWQWVGTVHAKGTPPFNSYSQHVYHFTECGLKSNLSYYYSISGVNDLGEGVKSLMVSAVPLGVLPPYFIAFVASLSAAIVFGSVILIQNRRKIMAIRLPEMQEREYHSPKTPEKKTGPGEISKEDVVDGYPKWLKKF